MQNITLAVPDDVYNEIKSRLGDDTMLIAKMQIAFAMGMFVTKEVNLVNAARIAGQNREEFTNTLKELDLLPASETE